MDNQLSVVQEANASKEDAASHNSVHEKLFGCLLLRQKTESKNKKIQKIKK